MQKIISDKTLRIIGEVLSEYAEEFVELAKKNLRDEGDATGELYDSIRFELDIHNEQVSVEIIMADYAQFVDEGRRAGKFPPPQAIENWVRSKGIVGRGDSLGANVERTAYVIGRSIAEKGTKGKHFIPQIDEKEIVRRIEQKASEALTEDIKREILKGTTIFR